MPSAVMSSHRELLGAISRKLETSLRRYDRDSEGLMITLPEPRALAAEAERISQIFQQGAPREPDRQQRINALARLRRGETDLSQREWTLIAWGLCDDCGVAGRPIDEQPLFDRIIAHIKKWIAHRDVPRKGWFGLLHSYLLYDLDAAADRGNWLCLRTCLVEAARILIAGLKRPKLWSQLIETHHDIFGENPGSSLRHVIFNGSEQELDHLHRGLPIPESSWLWRKLIAHQIDYLNGLDDTRFFNAIGPMVTFLRSRPGYADHVLGALLTRYCQSQRQGEAHELLKDESFSRWGNPQLQSATRWAMVDQAVKAMVLRWFAKEDLEHFFSLLQGSGQVDHARLHYWLRFVDQIAYTRILLGSDAATSQDPEFRNFRTKNAGRYGRLTGGPSHNNGFIMRIQDQYLVEFSGTGNACYAYAADELPFEPAGRELLTSRLKVVRRNEFTGTDNRILHMSGWEPKADYFLLRRNIRAGFSGPAARTGVANYKPQFESRLQDQSATAHLAPAPSYKPENLHVPAEPVSSIAKTVEVASAFARAHRVGFQNNLDKGGAFWVFEKNQHSRLGRELAKLRMTFNPDRGFWIK